MLRFALGPGGAVVPDIRRKLPGRGVWTDLSAEAVRRAAARGAFARAFRAKADAEPDLAGAVDALLERDALQSLSIANKAGLVVAGAFKVDATLVNGAAALIHASDGATDGAAKREQALRTRLGDAGAHVARINLFSSAQLGLALGKANVIHAAVKSGAAAVGLPGAGRTPASLSRKRGRRERSERRRRRPRRASARHRWPRRIG